MANIVNFTDKQFENRLNDNLEELVQGKKAVESPTAFLLGQKENLFLTWGADMAGTASSQKNKELQKYQGSI